MRNSLVLLLICIIVVSCREQKPLLPKLKGLPGEVLVVMPDFNWKSSPGMELKKVLTTTYEGLPQEEPMFDPVQINETAFGRLFKQYRNIIIVKTGTKYSDKKILLQKNLWANSQIVLTLIAPSDTSFINLLNENAYKILALISETERNRLISINKSLPDREINQKLAKKHNIKLAVPKSYRIYADSTDFTWLSSEYSDIIQGIFVYQYNYPDNNIFTKERLIEKRNQFLKKYIAGEVHGSYMITESLYPPLFKQYKLDKKNTTYELRGLWRLQDGLVMGGPFISISRLDTKHNRIITIEGFTFAPAHKKRELLRQAEAIVLSLEIIL